MGRRPLQPRERLRLAAPRSAFPLAVGISSQFTGLTIPEDPRPVYDVAADEVRYDAARRLWCCDIHVDAPQSYFPFVRLALARLQPNSIGGVELSKVVTLDCSQTSPDRTTLVDQSVAGSVGVTVTGPVGPGNRSSAANPVFTVSMWARLEQLQPGYADDLGWQAVSGSSVQLTEGAPVEGGSIVSWTGSIEPLPAAGTTPCGRVGAAGLRRERHHAPEPGRLPRRDPALSGDLGTRAA